jgi:hypothetical protein
LESAAGLAAAVAAAPPAAMVAAGTAAMARPASEMHQRRRIAIRSLLMV